MTLREELEDRADKLDAELLDLSGRIKEIERQSNELHTCLNALDIAEMDAEDEAREWAEAESLPVTDEQPELFEAEKSEAREQLEREDDASEFTESGAALVAEFDQPIAQLAVVDGQVVATLEDGTTHNISILTGDPAIEPESGLHEERPALNADMQDEREQPVTDVAALIASGEHSYDDVAEIAYPEPQWNEPAPVTNPEADERAKAHDWYDPKAVAERQKFNPFGIFGHKRETEEVS